MAQINLGTEANDGTGTTARAAGEILNATGLRKNNFAAGSAPTTGDDAGDGWEVGSLWGHAGAFYVCVNPTNPAVWAPAFPVLIGEEEAEEGSSTTVRAWTSQRVRQAAVAMLMEHIVLVEESNWPPEDPDDDKLYLKIPDA